MDNIFAEIQSSKQKKKLKKTKTKVTQRDGKVFIAGKTEGGELKQQYKETVDISGYLNEKKLSNEDIKVNDDYVELFDIENWYKDLKAVTFDTYFIPLTISNSQLITETFLQFHKQQKTNKWMKQQINNSKSLTILCSQINEIIIQNTMTDGCFCKLSSRSPKDATNEKLKEIYVGKMQELTRKNIEYGLNDCVQILFESGFESMQCLNGMDCLQNIIKSKRCYTDLMIALKYKDYKFKQNIIIRPWIAISSGKEFRAFIYDNKFVAMSQYNYTAKFDDIIKDKETIYKMIFDFWENKCREVLSKKYNKYIIDFAIIARADDKKSESKEFEMENVVVIELNPYENDTDSLLFDWKSKKDKKILQGKTEFEFRLQLKQFDKDDMWRLLPSHKELVENLIKL